MNINVIIIEIVVMISIFSLLTMGMLLINPLSFISDYPKEIQEVYYKSQHKEATKEKLTTIMIIKKIVAIVLYVFVLAWMSHLANCKTFMEGLTYAYFLILVLFSWDAFVLDWLLFPNIKRVRLKGTEHMDKEYHQKWFHVKACIPAIPVYIIMGIISSYVMILIY